MNYKVYVIGIELNSLNSRKSFESFLLGIGQWKRISDGFYIIKPLSTTPTSNDLRIKIPQSYYNDGQLFVMRTSIDASWNASTEVSSWLSANL